MNFNKDWSSWCKTIRFFSSSLSFNCQIRVFRPYLKTYLVYLGREDWRTFCKFPKKEPLQHCGCWWVNKTEVSIAVAKMHFSTSSSVLSISIDVLGLWREDWRTFCKFPKKEPLQLCCGCWWVTKLYIPSTLNIDLILWHIQLIVCAKNVKSWFKLWIFPFTFQAYILPHTLNCMCVSLFKFHIWILEQF